VTPLQRSGSNLLVQKLAPRARPWAMRLWSSHRRPAPRSALLLAEAVKKGGPSRWALQRGAGGTAGGAPAGGPSAGRPPLTVTGSTAGRPWARPRGRGAKRFCRRARLQTLPTSICADADLTDAAQRNGGRPPFEASGQQLQSRPSVVIVEQPVFEKFPGFCSWRPPKKLKVGDPEGSGDRYVGPHDQRRRRRPGLSRMVGGICGCQKAPRLVLKPERRRAASWGPGHRRRGAGRMRAPDGRGRRSDRW